MLKFVTSLNGVVLKKKKKFTFIHLNNVFCFRLNLNGLCEFFLYRKNLYKSFIVIYTLFLKQFTGFYKIYFRKVSYTGKSYGWVFKKNCLRLKFNKSNINILFYNFNTIFYQLVKNKIKLKYLLSYNISSLRSLFFITRRFNIFTSRGLKHSKSLFFKKKGKVSTYM